MSTTENQPPKAIEGKDESRDMLHRQLVKLGDMMADGLHHERGGNWINVEYKKVLYALHPDIKKQELETRKLINNNRAEKALANNKCSCGGDLKQSKSGSITLLCTKCPNKYRLKKKKKG